MCSSLWVSQKTETSKIHRNVPMHVPMVLMPLTFRINNQTLVWTLLQFLIQPQIKFLVNKKLLQRALPSAHLFVSDGIPFEKEHRFQQRAIRHKHRQGNEHHHPVHHLQKRHHPSYAHTWRVHRICHWLDTAPQKNQTTNDDCTVHKNHKINQQECQAASPDKCTFLIRGVAQIPPDNNEFWKIVSSYSTWTYTRLTCGSTGDAPS